MQPLKGLHHITAVAGDPQTNLDFYQQVLGQRLVKTTVNFDDPGTYHLYYGDRVGTPGTILDLLPLAPGKTRAYGQRRGSRDCLPHSRPILAFLAGAPGTHGRAAR